MSLKGKLINDVFNGKDPFRMLITTTAIGSIPSASYRLGQMCLDLATGDWYICTVIAGSGTWVKINA